MEEEFESRIKQLIGQRRRNTFIAHLQTILRASPQQTFGNYQSDRFVWWTKSTRMNLFYPVVRGRSQDVDGKAHFKLRAGMNPIGVMLCMLITATVAAFIVVNGIKQGYDWFEYGQLLMLCLLIPVCFTFAFRSERRVILRALREELQEKT